MTRKDFIAIAAALREAKRVIRSNEYPKAEGGDQEAMLDAVDTVTDYLIPALHASNPGFKTETFKTAADYGNN